MLKLYIIGICILVVAILANAIIQTIGIKSWYGFIEILSKFDWSGFSQIRVIDYLWLFIAYPLVLSLGYLLGSKLNDLLFS
ncbi:MAG: hypothetical protein HRU26_11490 [Psychroserpens sp.]|nr:hypothetical protein [Psychroserpens sp.]